MPPQSPVTICRPRLKESENVGVSWRRKSSSRSKHPRRRSSTPPTARPTLVLPPMRFTGELSPEGGAPVVTSRVQQAAEVPPETFLGLDSSCHPSHPLPQPSAPSPGHLFYNSEDHSDITFIVGQEEWRFPAHTFVLGKAQATLSALLRSAQGGPQPDEVRDRLLSMEVRPGPVAPVIIKLPDMQPEIFEQILRYIYTGQVTFLTVDSTLRLLHPSRLYHLPQLTTHCLSHLSKSVTACNVLPVLSHLLCPESHGDDPSDSTDCCHDNDNERNELVFKCFLLVDLHADAVLQSEHFETLHHELMVEIVKRDTLEVSSESVVFDAVMRWACRACKKRRMELTSDNKCSVLGKALFLVRFLTMSPEDFLRGPVSQGILSKEDKEIFLSRLTDPASSAQLSLPDRWSGWKIAERRQRCQNLLAIASPHSDATDLSVSPTNSVVPPQGVGAKRTDRKKKSMSKKLLNGVGDLVICVIQLLD